MNFTAGNQYLADLLRGQTLSDADLNALVLFKIDTWWRRWRKRPSQTYIIPNPQLKGIRSTCLPILSPQRSGQALFANGSTFFRTSTVERTTRECMRAIGISPYLKQIPKCKKKPPLKDAKQLS